MESTVLRVLEYDKILTRLAAFTSFSLGRERALELRPTDDIRQAREWLAETAEARRLLEAKHDVSLGSVHDLRPLLEQAKRGSTIVPSDLNDIRSTLTRGRVLQRSLSRLSEQFPHVADVAMRISVPVSLIDEIARCVHENGEVLDSASETLARIRRELRESHSRLMERLQRIVSASANAPYLQEPIVTQRQGRYVIPLRAEFKGRIPGLVHDQSGTGATLFIEPLAVVDLNNRWRQAQLAEQEEIQRILQSLTEQVARLEEPIRLTVEALADLDLIIAKAHYANEIFGEEPELVEFVQEGRTRERGTKNAQAPRPGAESQATTHHPGSLIEFYQARHPLLVPDTVVPIDVFLTDEYFIVLITGPNTGGKTVSLKTTGLLTLMAQSGLAIPTGRGPRLTVFEQVFADIGDEQSIEQSLSTFSSHMTHIVDILAQADSRSLVLLDELGAGTDPEEGAALAQSLLGDLLTRRVTTFATTHYSELKVFAHNTPFVANASVEFDIETLSPTYRLSIGLPGRSNAFAIARRLGLPSYIVANAEALVSPQSMEAEAMLAEIKRAREAALAAESQARRSLRQMEAQRADLALRLSRVEEERRQVLTVTRQSAEQELETLRTDIAGARDQLVRIQGDGTLPAAQTLHQAWLAEAEAILARRADRTQALPSTDAPAPIIVEGPLLAGDRVWVPSLQASGELVSVGERDVEVKIGSFRIRLSQGRVELQQRDEHPAVWAGSSIPKATSPGMELDLRGLIVEDMLIELDRYLDDAYRAGLPFVRLIHGKGTGALRQAVRDELRAHPFVSEFRPGQANEGGEGVTVANLVQR